MHGPDEELLRADSMVFVFSKLLEDLFKKISFHLCPIWIHDNLSSL